MFTVIDGKPSNESRLRAGKSSKTFQARHSQPVALQASPQETPESTAS